MVEMRVQVVEALLQQIERAVGRDSSSPGEAGRSVDRAERAAEAVRFALRYPFAVQQLHAATWRLATQGSLAQVVQETLASSIALVHADLGDLRLVDPDGGLQPVARQGFDDVAEASAADDAMSAACGRSSGLGRQVLIAESDADFEPHLAAAATYEFRSVQATPLADYAGHLVGVVTTLGRAARPPAPIDLRLLELYGCYAGEQLAGWVRQPSGDEPDDPSGAAARAMLDALLVPASEPRAVVPPGTPPDTPPDVGPDPGPETPAIPAPPSSAPRARSPRTRGPRPRPFADALPDDRFAALADLVVTGLFSAELELDAARSLTGEGPLASRISAANDVLEGVVAQVRLAMVSAEIRDRQTEDPAGG